MIVVQLNWMCLDLEHGTDNRVIGYQVRSLWSIGFTLAAARDKLRRESRERKSEKRAARKRESRSMLRKASPKAFSDCPCADQSTDATARTLEANQSCPMMMSRSRKSDIQSNSRGNTRRR